MICLVGDGGLQFSMSELAALRDLGTWSAVLIWNNRGYGEIRTSMIAVDIEPAGVDVQPPDFAHIARAYALNYRRIDSAASLAQALREFAARPQAIVLEIFAEEFV